jgi:hypothetical protein
VCGLFVRKKMNQMKCVKIHFFFRIKDVYDDSDDEDVKPMKYLKNKTVNNLNLSRKNNYLMGSEFEIKIFFFFFVILYIYI